MVICLERGADLHMAQLMPLPLTVSCFSKIEIGFTFLVLAHPGSPGQRAVKRVCVCVCHRDDEINTIEGILTFSSQSKRKCFKDILTGVTFIIFIAFLSNLFAFSVLTLLVGH